MRIRKLGSLRILSLACALLALPASARADVIALVNGGRIEGEVVAETVDEVTVRVGNNSVTLKRADIQSIEKKLSPERELDARRSQLATDDVAGRVELARFCLEKHIPNAAAKAAELGMEAFEIDPKDATTIELLKKRLDWKFEQGGWVAPDSWYPAHGYVRKGGNWVTLELANLIDAEAATKDGKADEAASEKALAGAEKEVLAALEAESLARKELERIKADLESIDIKISGAREDLAAHESDLQRASDQVLIAQRDWNYLTTLAAPADSKLADDQRRRIEIAQALLVAATNNEARFRRLRDASLGVLNDWIDLKAEGPKRLAAAQGVVDSAQARGKAARELVPVKRETLSLARKRTDDLRAAEIRARTASADRKLAEAKAEAERDAALRKVEKPASGK